jgi:predicted TIM-barrel enzyme
LPATTYVVLVFIGPISKPEDAKYILRSTHDVHGFYGASSMERLPVEAAIADCVQTYKGISLYDSDENSNHV